MIRFSPVRALSGALLVLTLLAPAAPSVGAQETDARFFSQTNYRIDNDAFWSYFQSRGGVDTFGYPVSRLFRLDGFQVQIFQRNVMQLWPDNSVHTLNLLDEGLLPYTQINQSTFPAAIPRSSRRRRRPLTRTTTRRSFSSYRSERRIRSRASRSTSVRPSITRSPRPMRPTRPRRCSRCSTSRSGARRPASPARDPNNSNFIYQRFQRSIMHYDRGCGCTQGLLLADYLKSIMTGQNLPPDLEAQARNSKYYRQYAPGQPLSIARPAELPNSDLTNAFVTQQARRRPVPGRPTERLLVWLPGPHVGPERPGQGLHRRRRSAGRLQLAQAPGRVVGDRAIAWPVQLDRAGQDRQRGQQLGDQGDDHRRRGADVPPWPDDRPVSFRPGHVPEPDAGDGDALPRQGAGLRAVERAEPGA